jgi:DNA polymerase III subunit epsilon
VPTFAIDFETANALRSSPCALGLTYLDGPNQGTRRSWLIRPDPLEFDDFNVSIHGITEGDVADAPLFQELWTELRPEFEGATVLAHNAAFDFSVLRAVLADTAIAFPALRYHCSMLLSRAVWPGLVNYRLPTVARHLGIKFDHHDAASDAWACAQITLRVCDELGVSTVDEAAERLHHRCGTLNADGYIPAGRISRVGGSIAKLAPKTTQFDEDHPFHGKRFAFTGTLQSMTREKAAQWVVDHGGQCTNSVSSNLHYLVIGDQDFSRFIDGQMSTKMRKAKELIGSGCSLELIPEIEFLQMGR